MTRNEVYILETNLTEFPDNKTFEEILDLIEEEDESIIVWCTWEYHPPQLLVEILQDMCGQHERTLSRGGKIMSIKDNMTKGKWEVWNDSESRGRGQLSIECGANTVAWVRCGRKTSKANAQAIVTAVNATYGKGINPECVGELVEALEKISDSFNETEKKRSWYNRLIENVGTARQALEKARLT